VALWVAAIAWGSVSPGGRAHAIPDSLVHAGAYLVLVWLLRRALAASDQNHGLVLPAALAFGFGLLMEGIQASLLYRSAEFHDVVANAVGIVAGLMVRAPGGPRGLES
jgi:VanZ family protein